MDLSTVPMGFEWSMNFPVCVSIAVSERFMMHVNPAKAPFNQAKA
jgi:hypothetical protein